MEWASSELVNLLYYLLPGFFSAWIFYGLTAHRRPTPFERVVQALIFTAIIQVPVFLCEATLLFLGSNVVVMGTWSKDVGFVLSMCVALVLGHVLAACANNNLYHPVVNAIYTKLAKWWPWTKAIAITKRTSFPSEWFSALNEDKRYVVLHLLDGRRVFGWPYEWPDHSDTGHFVLMQAEWVLEDNQRAPLHNVERMLVPATEIRFVDILKFDHEITATPEEEAAVDTLLRKNRLANQKSAASTLTHGDSNNGSESTPTTTG